MSIYMENTEGVHRAFYRYIYRVPYRLVVVG